MRSWRDLLDQPFISKFEVAQPHASLRLKLLNGSPLAGRSVV
jgi:hypothetical protein